VAMVLPAGASTLENPNGYNFFAGVGKNQGNTNSFYVAGNYTLSNSTPILRYANVTSDTGVLQFYSLTNMTSIVNPTNSGTTNLIVVSTNNYSAGQVVVIKHIATDTYECLPLQTVANTNQLTLGNAPLSQCATGDQIWVAGATGSISAVGTNLTITQSGEFLYAGQYKTPLLITVTGTAKVGLNCVAGAYQ